MLDPIFADPRLAAVYDAFDGPRDDLDPYLALAVEVGARRIVDLGCGTGSLALRLTAPNRHLVGVDPARASLAVARAKPGAETVTWIEGDATAIPRNTAADLVVMVGNTAQAVVDDHTWASLLRHAHTALAPGGHLVFESRRPETRPWQHWTTKEPVVVPVPGVGVVERDTELVAVELPLVSFRHTYRFHRGTDPIVSESTIRFRDRPELEHDLGTAGFTVREVRDAPDRPGRELVLFAARD